MTPSAAPLDSVVLLHVFRKADSPPRCTSCCGTGHLALPDEGSLVLDLLVPGKSSYMVDQGSNELQVLFDPSPNHPGPTKDGFMDTSFCASESLRHPNQKKGLNSVCVDLWSPWRYLEVLSLCPLNKVHSPSATRWIQLDLFPNQLRPPTDRTSSASAGFRAAVPWFASTERGVAGGVALPCSAVAKHRVRARARLYYLNLHATRKSGLAARFGHGACLWSFSLLAVEPLNQTSSQRAQLVIQSHPAKPASIH